MSLLSSFSRVDLWIAPCTCCSHYDDYLLSDSEEEQSSIENLTMNSRRTCNIDCAKTWKYLKDMQCRLHAEISDQEIQTDEQPFIR